MSIYEDQPITMQAVDLLTAFGEILGEADTTMPAQYNEKQSEHCDMIIGWDLEGMHEIQLFIEHKTSKLRVRVNLTDETRTTLKHCAIVGYCCLHNVPCEVNGR